MNGIPCAHCGWTETAHAFKEEYPAACDHYVPERHLIDINRRKPDHPNGEETNRD